jgi:polysaccharide export outer membrane protein
LKLDDRKRVYRVTAAALCLAAGLTFSSSCSSPPSQDDGLVGILYHKANSSRGGSLAEKKTVYQPHTTPLPVAPVVQVVTTNNQGISTNFMAEPLPCYRISPGDILAVSYFARPPGDLKEYLVDSQDVLTISIAGQEAYMSDVTVRPDGCISFYMVRNLWVRGKTIGQVRGDVAAQVSDVMPSAEVTVILKSGNGLAREFLGTLLSNTDMGSTRVMQVRHDGAVTFPLIGEVHAVGKTMALLSREVETQYDRVFRGGISVNLNLNSSSEGNIAVLGEVRNPGRYTIVNPVSAFFALAMAGGALDTAKESQVVVVNRLPDGRATWHVINLDVNSGRPLGPDIALAPQDMLLVPKTGIANLNLFVEQYIRRLLPVPTGVGVNYNLN